MFSLFSNQPEEEKKRAQAAYEKVVSLRGDTREARSARIRMGLLCRAHLDKTFVAGAEQTASYLELVALAIARGKEKPTPPEPTPFQKVATASSEVYAYLPEEFTEEAFALGARYQRTDITAQQAIDYMQALADRLFLYELRLEEPFQVLQFLRDEMTGSGNGEPSDTPDRTPSHPNHHGDG